MVEPSKGPKKANNRLNSTWNTTRCKVASFFLFSLRLLPKVFRILPVEVIRVVIYLAHAPRVLHFNAFIPNVLLWLANISTKGHVLVYMYTYMYTFTYCR